MENSGRQEIDMYMKSEQQRLEELLEDNEFLYHIFHSINDGIILTDPEGRITFINPATEKILGIAKKKLLGIKATEINVTMYTHEKKKLQKKDKPFQLTERTREDQGAQKIMLQRPDGKAIPLLFNVGRAEDGQMVAILTDVSEMMEKQEQMEEYFNLVAHDLRTPLTAILGYAQTMKDGNVSKFNSETILNRIWDAGKSMKEMIEDITDRIRLKSGNYELEKSEVPLMPVIQEVVAQHKSGDDHPRIKIEVPSDIVVHADVKLLKRVLHNLISNAVKHAPDKSLITLGGEHNECCVILTVSDQGQGIHPEDQSYIFDPFFITSIGKQKGGIGLGLHITAEIVKAHEGNIYVCSQEGEGATFALQFPWRGLNADNTQH